MCKLCDRVTNPHKHGGVKPTKSYIPKRTAKPTGQVALFGILMATREPVSFISGIPVDVTIATTYAHVLSKSQNKYPKFKLYDKNIVFLSPEEHHLFDHGSSSGRDRYKDIMWKENKVLVDWDKLYTLVEELKKEYTLTNNNYSKS